MFNAVCTKNRSHRRNPQHRRGKNEIIQKSGLNLALWHCRDTLIGLSDPVGWNLPCSFLFANGVETFSSRLVGCSLRQQKKPSQVPLWLGELIVSTVLVLALFYSWLPVLWIALKKPVSPQLEALGNKWGKPGELCFSLWSGKSWEICERTYWAKEQVETSEFSVSGNQCVSTRRGN